MMELAAKMGRSVSSLYTRCSQLVGVEKKELLVSGDFEGFLNDEHVKGLIKGTVKK